MSPEWFTVFCFTLAFFIIGGMQAHDFVFHQKLIEDLRNRVAELERQAKPNTPHCKTCENNYFGCICDEDITF